MLWVLALCPCSGDLLATPHQLVKGVGHSVPLELHPEQLVKA